MINEALKYYGVQEIVGEKHNQTIVDWFAKIGHSWVKNDELAWCSVFANLVAKRSGKRYTKKLNARSWMDNSLGDEINPEDAKPGDIVVFSRGSNPVYGHVALFVNYDEDNIHINVLGGNQGNMVKIAGYNKNRLLKIVRLYEQEKDTNSRIGRSTIC